ncbi:MAG: DPP IV N-terminal domain-containing protein [Anaerolineae bacterium]
MSRFVPCVGLLLALVFSVGVLLVSAMGQWVSYDGEIRYLSHRDNIYVPYGLDVLRHVTYQILQPIPATAAYWVQNLRYLIVERDGATSLVDMDSGAVQQVFDTQISLRWSPDGEHIAFASWTGGIYLANGDGTDVTPLTPNDANGPFAFSPDSTQLAYIYDGDLYVLNLMEDRVTALTSLGELSESALNWSPDGQWIAVTWQTSDAPEFYLRVVSRRGGNQHDFVSPLRFYNPVWSSDSTRVIFIAGNDELNVYMAVLNDDTIHPFPLSDGVQALGLTEGFIGNDRTLRILWSVVDSSGMTVYEDDVDMTTGELLRRAIVPMRSTVQFYTDDWVVSYENNHICIWSRATDELRDCYAVAAGDFQTMFWLP